MTTIWNLPRIEIRSLSEIKESRPTALLTGKTAWGRVHSYLGLPLVVQAEPTNARRNYMDKLAEGLPEQAEVVYGVGGGLVADVAKYIGWRRGLPVVLVPTVLSVDGFFTALVAVREEGTVGYEITGPVDRVVIDWDVVSTAPAHFRGTGIAEILSMVTGLMDWRYAAERNMNTAQERFQQWAASLAAGIAQQAFKIAPGVGEGRVDALRNLLDLICVEVQLTNQLGHNRPQEGSEQYFAYAIEPRVARNDRGVPYADLIGPGIMLAAALHGQDVRPIRQTLLAAGIRLGQLRTTDIIDTLQMLPNYVQRHDLPYSILHNTEISRERAEALVAQTGLDSA
ncbi:MAG: iron-containing alcohol dehydrogenase [Anaerolineaceae bacterium]|nr:MAG: iron-containing alcohol dehydrogenase [Anaerolineaceae bacterium]